MLPGDLEGHAPSWPHRLLAICTAGQASQPWHEGCWPSSWRATLRRGRVWLVGRAFAKTQRALRTRRQRVPPI